MALDSSRSATSLSSVSGLLSPGMKAVLGMPLTSSSDDWNGGWIELGCWSDAVGLVPSSGPVDAPGSSVAEVLALEMLLMPEALL